MRSFGVQIPMLPPLYGIVACAIDRFHQVNNNIMISFEAYMFGTNDDAPQLFDYINMDAINNPDGMADAEGFWNIEDVLDAAKLYRQYPWLTRNVTVKFTHSNNRALNGEILRIITLGGGEGTIFVNIDAWDDHINSVDPKVRGQLVHGLLHEIGHAVDDHDGNLEYSTDEEKQRAERFATDFANKWSK
jgi:hypothetical protein